MSTVIWRCDRCNRLRHEDQDPPNKLDIKEYWADRDIMRTERMVVCRTCYDELHKQWLER